MRKRDEIEDFVVVVPWIDLVVRVFEGVGVGV